MKSFYIRRPKMYDEAAKGKSGGIIKTLLIFVLFMIIVSMAEGIIPMIMSFIEGVKFAASGASLEKFDAEAMTNSLPFRLVSLFSTVFAIIGAIIYCVCIEKRTLSSMGIKKKHATRDYFMGCLIGFVMFSAVVLVNVLLGGMKFEGFNSNVSIGLLFVFLAGFVIQGMSEEFVCRGYLMNTIGGKHSMTTAVIISSVIFMALHLGNKGLSIIAIVNLVLIAVFFAVYMICFDNIWGVCAFHSIWNFAQGNIYGIKVSGTDLNTVPVFTVTQTEESSLINGGAFGAEGGFGTTIVIFVSLALLVVYMIKTGKAGFTEKTAAKVE